MIVRTLNLKAFRNYADAAFDFSPGVNIIVGENAQGKTNLIESLFFLSRGYSHRAANKTDLIAFGAEDCVVRGSVAHEDHTDHIGARIAGGKKTLICNGKKTAKQEDISKVCKVILFEPEDLRIVKAGPEKRRRFLDEEITGYMPGCYYVLKNYQKSLKQRNTLLRDIRYDSTLKIMLEGWDAQLAQYGAKLMAYRIDYLKRLRTQAAALHDTMSGGKETLALYYQNNVLKDLKDIRHVNDIAGLFFDQLKAGAERDIERGTTCVGPHLDDLLITVNGKDARKYASQGQQRTAAIALKLSRIAITRESTGESPVVLLDDVLSELDEHRQIGILKMLRGTQTFITCTDDSFVKKYRDVMGEAEVKTFEIVSGEVLRQCNAGEESRGTRDEGRLTEKLLD